MIVAAVAACDSDAVVAPAEDLRARFGLEPLPATPYPPDNPFVTDRVELGRLLFFDPILSGEQDVACGTCHHPDFAFADGRQFGAGVSGIGLGPDRVLGHSSVTGEAIEVTPRNTPTVLNAALNGAGDGASSFDGLQFWDGRASGLEAQALRPIASRDEMRGDAFVAEQTLDSLVARLRSIDGYVTRFVSAFPDEAAGRSAVEVIDEDTYARAVAAYERELVTRNSAFDRYVAGDDQALTAEQERGLELFFADAGCASCHSGARFTDDLFHVLAVPQEGPGKVRIPGDDTGREEHTGAATDRYAFRTPGLRNVALTAPYMHDGVFETLEEVVRFYDAGARPRHSAVDTERISPLVTTPLGLSGDDVAALVAFMESLTDPGQDLDRFLTTVPDSVPSGLVPVFGGG